MASDHKLQTIKDYLDNSQLYYEQIKHLTMLCCFIGRADLVTVRNSAGQLVLVTIPSQYEMRNDTTRYSWYK